MTSPPKSSRSTGRGACLPASGVWEDKQCEGLTKREIPTARPRRGSAQMGKRALRLPQPKSLLPWRASGAAWAGVWKAQLQVKSANHRFGVLNARPSHAQGYFEQAKSPTSPGTNIKLSFKREREKKKKGNRVLNEYYASSSALMFLLAWVGIAPNTV